MTITLNALRLHQTIANLYTRSIAILTPQSNVQLTHIQREELCTFLIQGYQSQLKCIATQRTQINHKASDCSSSNNESMDEQIHTARSTLLAWEESQFIAMSLVKYSIDCSLYKSWCALATMQHWKSCKILLQLLAEYGNDDDEDMIQEKKKLEQKRVMLPRLAEMWMQKVCSISTRDEEGGKNTFPPSADDWRIFKECLDAQEKYKEMIDILSNVQCGADKQGRQIDDEHDVRHHMGSLIQLTERERIEMIVESNVQLGNFEEVITLYSHELLDILPDQWSYWDSLVTYSLQKHKNVHEKASEECNKTLKRVLDKQDILRAEGKTSRVPLRGPHLSQLKTLSEGIIKCQTNDFEGLCNGIQVYGNLFSGQVSCCFQDLRPYIECLCRNHVTKGETLSDETLKLIDWAKKIYEANNPSETNDKTERRSKLRAYINAIKILLELWYQSLSRIDSANVDQRSEVDTAFLSHLPTVDQLIHLWENVLDLGSNPSEGGQKETLPGDDIILIVCQLLIHQSCGQPGEKKESLNFLVAAILENAIAKSPYNPYLKIAAINVYIDIGAADRAWDLFQEMNVNHVQLDSCSYIILPHLISSGLYKEAVGHAGTILNIHSNSSRDISKFMPKSFENGNLTKGIEMISWQNYEMNQSVQLLQAKSLAMDLAPLLTTAIGLHHGINGIKSTDIVRVEELIRESSNHHSASSIIGLCNHQGCDDTSWSDNRDLTINELEILERTKHDVSANDSMVTSHVHAILTRIVLLVDVTKAPKKGKIVKHSVGGTLDIRVKSVLETLDKAQAFVESSKHLSNLHTSLWNAMITLCRTICLLSTGISAKGEEPNTPNDNLNSRESRCVEMLNKSNEKIREAIEAWKSIETEVDKTNKFVCRLLPELLVPTFVTVRTVANVFALFNWGKRKRNTKVAVGALVDTALSLQDLTKLVSDKFLTDLPQSKDDEQYVKEISGAKYALMTYVSLEFSELQPFIQSLEKKGSLDLVVEKKSNYKLIIGSRLKPFFVEIINELETFNVTE